MVTIINNFYLILLETSYKYTLLSNIILKPALTIRKFIHVPEGSCSVGKLFFIFINNNIYNI